MTKLDCWLPQKEMFGRFSLDSISRSFFRFVVQCARECCAFLTSDVKQHHPMRRHLKTISSMRRFSIAYPSGVLFLPGNGPCGPLFLVNSFLIKDKITNFSGIFRKLLAESQICPLTGMRFAEKSVVIALYIRRQF
ncbi:hypothetical protein [Oscillibacter sp.]|uniref:hypothetical protein n=1 Tax=Oscillibacter sp. TaxID=1945593 RepID=UPI0028A20C94|nr:hypothetical protein [Oscillibacter sp.]